MKLEGVIPPLVTPLRDRDTLDAEGLERLIERVTEGGVAGLFILGTTGEGPSLSYKLRRVLGFKAEVPLEDGLRDLVAWWRSRQTVGAAA